jgi:hypothetical protein
MIKKLTIQYWTPIWHMHDGTIATIKLPMYNKHDVNNNQTTISYKKI